MMITMTTVGPTQREMGNNISSLDMYLHV